MNVRQILALISIALALASMACSLHAMYIRAGVLPKKKRNKRDDRERCEKPEEE